MGHHFSPLVTGKPEEKLTLLENAFCRRGFLSAIFGTKSFRSPAKTFQVMVLFSRPPFSRDFSRRTVLQWGCKLHSRSKNIFTRHRRCGEHFLSGDNNIIHTEIIPMWFSKSDPQNFNAISRNRRFVGERIHKFRQYTNLTIKNKMRTVNH